MINVIVLEGTVATEPTTRFTPTGKQVTEFRLRVPRKDASGNWVGDFISVVAWEPLAERCSTLPKKARLVVTGRWQNREYDAQDGGKRKVEEIIAADVRLVQPLNHDQPGPLDERYDDGEPF